jgi:hypothetical protein
MFAKLFAALPTGRDAAHSDQRDWNDIATSHDDFVAS